MAALPFFVKDRKLRGGLYTPLFVLALVAFYFFLGANFGEEEGDASNSKSNQLVFGVLFFVVAAVAGLAFRTGVMRRSREDLLSADSILKHDNRAPVLYLRAFNLDQEAYRLEASRFMAFANPLGVIAYLSTIPRTFEELLVVDVDQVGPVIALSQPSSHESFPGVPKLPALGADWQSVVTRLIDECGLIILRTGLGEGLTWELNELKRRNAMSKVVIAVEFYKDDNQEIRAARYAKFAKLLERETGLKVPAYDKKLKYIYCRGGDVVPLTLTTDKLTTVIADRGLPIETSKARSLLKASIPGASYLMRPYMPDTTPAGKLASAALLLLSALIAALVGAAASVFIVGEVRGALFAPSGLIGPAVCCALTGVAIGRMGGALTVAGAGVYVAAGFVGAVAFFLSFCTAFAAQVGLPLDPLGWTRDYWIVGDAVVNGVALAIQAAIDGIVCPLAAWIFGLSRSELEIVRGWRAENRTFGPAEPLAPPPLQPA